MTRRIRNVVAGTVIAIAVWVVWSFVRQAILERSRVFENIGRSVPAALLSAIVGYSLTRRDDHHRFGNVEDDTYARTNLIHCDVAGASHRCRTLSGC